MRLHSPYEYLSDIVITKPKAILFVVGIVLFIALVGTTFITMQTGSETYLDKTTERGVLLDKYTKTFQSDSLMLLVESDDVLDPEVLSYMDRLAREVALENSVSGVSSIVDLARTMNGGNIPGSRAEIEMARERLPPEVLARYVPSNMMTIMIVTLEPGLSQKGKTAVLNNIGTRIELSSPPPGVHVVVTGDPAFQQQMGREMGQSMGTLILVAMVLMVIAVGVFFSHVRLRFLSVILVASGLLLTFGVIGFAGMPITMITIGAFPVLIGIGIDYSIQFHSRFDEEARRSSLPDAARTTIVKSGPAVLLAMISTSMGFLALLISPIPMIRSFGLVCVIGVACCYLLALVAVPAVGLVLQYKPRAGENSSTGDRGSKHAMESYNDFLGKVAGKVARHPVPILILCGLVAFIGFQMDNEIIINTNEDSFVPPDMPAIVDLKKVSRTMGSTTSLPIYVRGDNVLDIEALSWMRAFEEYEVTHNDKVTGAASIADSIIQYNGGTLPGTKEEVESALQKVPEQTRKRFLNGNNEAIIAFSTIDMENEVALSMIEDVRRDLSWHQPPPGITARVTGMGEMFGNLINEIGRGKTQMTFLAFILIFVFLLGVYRKFGKSVTPVIPIMMIVGWNGLIMYVLGIDYTPLTATLGSMTIGVASEYTILIMERAYEERAAGAGLVPAITKGVQQIGTAITVSGMTTVFGFAALISSSFNIISNFGVVTVITVGFSLIGAIIVMPAVLVLVGRIGSPGREGEGPGESD
ncbi:MAG: RND family transporter [Methanolinea sp.]|nr:RND family transporter [Methanolinea sp.]